MTANRRDNIVSSSFVRHWKMPGQFRFAGPIVFFKIVIKFLKIYAQLSLAFEEIQRSNSACYINDCIQRRRGLSFPHVPDHSDRKN